MSSSYNNSIASSSTQSFLLSGAAAAASGVGATNFNRDQEPPMTMLQPPPNSTVAPPPKKRRNQPGNPNPDAEVIALSPKTIMATNRFICEVCNKGFQREQNLQLHRRGHNLPWKLKQKSNKEVRRKVYLCPEPSCVHHDPARALGDLTGIKKHYYRKHGEKKWKCDKCSKRYAVQSDWKAHSKTCGTKEYRCDCGTIFSRRDSYITHRAFCDALIQESARNPTVSFTAMAAAGGGAGRHGFFGGAASALSHNHFGGTSASGFTSLAASYNLNRSSSDKFEEYAPQSANPNPGGPPNFLMQCAANQGLLAQNDQGLMNQHGLMNLGDHNLNSNNNNLFNLGYFQDTKNPNQTSVPSLFTGGGADNNDSSALLRGLPPSSPSSVVVNDYGDTGNGNLQGLIMNTLADSSDHQSRSGSIFDLHFGSNLSMGGSDRLTLDFLGVNGGGMVSTVNGRGGRNGAPLDTEMKFSHPNHPFGKA
ncbi:hypothetical protein CARUB_v10009023mg [Capsella rubella]|uniref:C2H2-type domain-containing protein n=3 Tax=Capsella rubella TaxID=81985 RepID=R0GWH3_9BRAS|nr:hypothetical protein CARUB_v10009023mg [Capsella rubella]